MDDERAGRANFVTLAGWSLVAAPVALAVAFYAFLGHRTDYLGHYLAGYAGTLGAGIVALAAIPEGAFRRWAAAVLVAVVLGAIALGGWFESTIYRLARFDEVDFCNQSLGAALAGLGLLSLAAAGRPPTWLIGLALAWAGVLMAGGYHFAFL